MIECLRSFLVNIARMFLPKAGADAEVSDEDKGSEHSSDCNNIVTSESQKQYFTNFTLEWMHRQFSLASEFDTNTGEDICTKLMLSTSHQNQCTYIALGYPLRFWGTNEQTN